MKAAAALLFVAGCGPNLADREACYSRARLEFWATVEQCADDDAKSVEQCRGELDGAMNEFQRKQEACP